MSDQTGSDLSGRLPRREGSRPLTRREEGTAHAQQSQNAPRKLQEMLFERTLSLASIYTGESLVSVPGARAFFLEESIAAGPEEAFQAGREFAHIHPVYDGSMHLTLPPAMAREVEEKGWGERHPISASMMVYGPRDEAELEVVWQLLLASYRFASGENEKSDERSN
jgi:Family of unknown function (DUF5519)